MTTETYLIWADPPEMKAAELPTVAQQLSGPLGLPAAKILSLLQHPTSTEYVKLASGVSVANDQKIEALSVYNAGIYDDASYAMAYPDGEATANVVGFANVNQQTGVISRPGGRRAGVQQAADRHHRQRAVREGPQRPADPAAAWSRRPAQNGDSIKLTINSVLQYDAMKACEQEVDKSQAKSCTAVIIQPKTGDILAMAQWPTWDQNTLAAVADATDLPDQDMFTPGSTAKVITAAAAFEHGGKTPMSAYTIPYQIYRGGQWIRDAEYSANERYTIAGIIANSSNVGMSQVDAERPAADPVRLPAQLRPRRAHRPRPPGRDPGPARAAVASGRPTSATRSPTARASRSTRSRWPASTRRSPTTASGCTPRLVEGTYNAAGQYTAGPAVEVHPGDRSPRRPRS